MSTITTDLIVCQKASILRQRRQKNRAEELFFFINGRRFSWKANSDLVIGTLTLIDRMFFQMGKEFGIVSPYVHSEVQKHTFPELSLTMTNIIGEIFHAEKIKDTRAQLIYTQTLKDLYQSTVNPWLANFIKTGVRTLPEFQKNQRDIKELKKEARRLYFSNPANIARKLLCDEMLIKISGGENEREVRFASEMYWERVAKNPWNNEFTQAQEELFESLFPQRLLKAVNDLEDLEEYPAADLLSYLHDIVSKSETFLLENNPKVLFDQMVMHHYTVIRCHLICPSLINRLARRHLFKIVSLREAQAEQAIPCLEQEKAEELTYYEEELVKILAHEQFLLKNRGEQNEKELHRLTQTEKMIQTKLERVRKRNCCEMAYQGSGRSDLRKEIPEMTPFDQLISQLKLYRIHQRQTHVALDVPEDLLVDLSKIENPVVFFLKQMEEETERQFKLLHAFTLSNSPY